MSLGACATKTPDEPLTQTVAVKATTVPSADLLICPEAPDGFPVDAIATMPAPVRDAAERLAKAYGDLRGRFSRLIAWNGGKSGEVANAQGG